MLRHGLDYGGRGGGGRIGRRPGAGRGAAHAATWGATATTRAKPPRQSSNTSKEYSRGTSGPHLAQRRTRCLGGREGSRTDARPALRNRRVRGRSAPTRPRAGTAIFRHHDHLDRLFKSAELYYMPIPYTLEELRTATHELIARQRAARVLHPPDRVPRLRPDGPVPARRAGRGLDRGVAVGRLPRRGGQEPAASAPRSRAGGGSRTTR